MRLETERQKAAKGDNEFVAICRFNLPPFVAFCRFQIHLPHSDFKPIAPFEIIPLAS